MTIKNIFKEALSLLYWTMLAAGTVGPGTVVTCARAGAEFELNLIWALIFATLLAYTLQEGTARLTIISGKSLGQCLQVKYKHGRKIWKVGVICWVAAASVFIGNLFFECNNIAGGMAAIYSLPGANNTHALRISCCFGYGVLVLAILFADKVNSLGIGLGVVLICMAILFLVVVTKLGVDGTRFAKGLLPISMPSGSTNIVLSLIGTTAVGSNLFLGGAMANKKTLPQAQRGIAFSTVMTLVVSVLILIVGDGTHNESKGAFTIASLSGIITRLTGVAGIWIFGISFIAAAISSMLTAPLCSALTADSVFTINYDEGCHGETSCSYNVIASEVKLPVKSEDSIISEDNIINTEMDIIEKDAEVRQFPMKYYNGLMFIMVLIAAIVIAADAPTIKVILIAQVINGCLLPFFSICLLICLNDEQFMKKSPQHGWANCLLVAAVMVTLFLTVNTIIQNIFGWVVTRNHATESTFETVKFTLAGICSVLVICITFIITDLGRNIRNSLTCCQKT